MMRKARITPLAFALAAALSGAASCSPNTPTTDHLSISGNLSLPAIGKTSALVARLFRADGSSQDVTNDSEWTTDNPAVATISPTGVLTAVGFGATKVTARYGKTKALGGTESLSDVKQAQVVEPAVTSLRLTGNLSLDSVGATSQLTVTATLADGTTLDVTSATTWIVDDASVASVQAGGVLSAKGLGVTFVVATYKTRSTSGTVVVTPPGTIATGGRVRLPGAGGGEGLGVAGFQIVDTQSGQTTTSNAEGHYTMAGLISGTRLTFNKDGFEPVERVVTSPSGDVAVQKVVRITAGDTAQSETAPNDVSYTVTPGGPCLNCRLIRMTIPAAGTLHLSLSWDLASVTESLWIQGQVFSGSNAGPLTADVPVQPGELVMYAGTTKPVAGRYVILKLATSMALPDLLHLEGYSFLER